mmetsp:Transcript_17525/g.33922  ORF Transcript_17525/g.33922 Transcript_17525/m.33922 type:complete len:106 (-) Transcript_17525:1106-1423(-)
MGYDPLSPALYTYNKDNEGNIDSVQSHTILGSGHVSFLFKKNVPGMWFTQQGDEVLNKLLAAYETTPYPSKEEMEHLAKEVNAPGITQIKTFYQNMHEKEINGYL